MQCPNCGYEPRSNLLSSPCPNKNCNFIWFDTTDYVKLLADDLPEIQTVLDIGCGQKGVIAQNYWENRNVKGYACDRFTIKALPDIWTPLLNDAENLVEILGEKSIDFVTHCGLLEHLEYEKAFKVLEIIEKVAKKRVFFTFSALLRDVDYKVKHDGNPYHYYKSWWDARTIECLGYSIDRFRMSKHLTFVEEVTGWFDPDNITTPFEERKEKAIESICSRQCCGKEPVFWDAECNDKYLCLSHYAEKINALSGNESRKIQVKMWSQRQNINEVFPVPPWRDKQPII